MLKVYLKGRKTIAVIGKYLTEDERYLFLLDGRIKRKVPHDNIAYIEDLSEYFQDHGEDDYVAPQSHGGPPSTPSEPEIPQIEQAKRKLSEVLSNKSQNLSKEDIAKKLRETLLKNVGDLSHISQVEPEDLEDDHHSPVTTGANKILARFVENGAAREFVIPVSDESFNSPGFTLKLGREILDNPEVKAFLSGKLLVSAPMRDGPIVTYSVRPKEAASSLGGIGNLSSIGKIFESMGSATPTIPTNTFSMPMNIQGSPFDTAVKLDLGDDTESDEHEDT